MAQTGMSAWCTTSRTQPEGCATWLAEEVFELDAGFGFGVAVFYDYGGLEGEVVFGAAGMSDGAGAGDDDGFFGDAERLSVGGGVDAVVNQIVDGNGAIEDGAGAEDGAAFDDGTFVDAGVAAKEDLVFDDDGKRADGFENAADLCTSGDVAMAADLRAAPDQRVGIDHGVFANVRADVDEHGRHADHAATEEGAIADAGAAGNDADAVGESEGANGIGGLVVEGLFRGVDGHIDDGSHAKAEKNSLFHPGISAPAGG